MSHETDLADLQAAREATLEKFRAAANLIAEGLREYGVVWARATRASYAAAKHVPGRVSLCGPLQPTTSKHHPRFVKISLGRILRAAGVKATDYSMRLGARQR
jgi:hypothetical protein